MPEREIEACVNRQNAAEEEMTTAITCIYFRTKMTITQISLMQLHGLLALDIPGFYPLPSSVYVWLLERQFQR